MHEASAVRLVEGRVSTKVGAGGEVQVSQTQDIEYLPLKSPHILESEVAAFESFLDPQGTRALLGRGILEHCR